MKSVAVVFLDFRVVAIVVFLIKRSNENAEVMVIADYLCGPCTDSLTQNENWGRIGAIALIKHDVFL